MGAASAQASAITIDFEQPDGSGYDLFNGAVRSTAQAQSPTHSALLNDPVNSSLVRIRPVDDYALTGPAEQKRRAISAAFHPTLPSLYSDKDVLAANPFFASLADTFKNTVPRPSTVTGEKYNQVSSAFWNAVHAVLAKQKPAKDSLAELSANLDRVKGPKW
jgi:hypothetical protein